MVECCQNEKRRRRFMGRNPYGKNLVVWGFAIAVAVASFVVGVVGCDLFALICGFVCVGVDCCFFGYFVAKFVEWQNFDRACYELGSYIKSCIAERSKVENKKESPFEEFKD